MPREQLFAWRYFTCGTQPEHPARIANEHEKHLFFWARNAIYHSLRSLGIPAGARVLVPSYICAAAIEPIVAHGALVEFYRIDRDCQADLADLESRIDSKTQAILVAHYFGFPQQILEFRSICDQHKLCLIEDCAHVLLGQVNGRALGSFGDVSVFSWRKFLPLFDGASLLLNRHGATPDIDWTPESLLFTLKEAKSLFEQFAESGELPALRTMASGLESAMNLAKRALSKKSRESPLMSANGTIAGFDPALANQPMTWLSRWVMKHSDVLAIVEKRRANYLYLLRELRAIPGLKLPFGELPTNVCPWVFPLIFDEVDGAHLSLRKRGIPAVNWSGVRYSDLQRGSFPDADFLYENLVFLPIHQSLSDKDLERVAVSVRALCQAAGG